MILTQELSNATPVGAVQLAGEWEREFDAVGNPVELPIHPLTSLPLMLFTSILTSKILNLSDISSNNMITTELILVVTITARIRAQVKVIRMVPRITGFFALTMNQAETLIDGYAPAGSYAVEIFIDSDTGIEQRLVGAVQLAGEWERELDAVGNPVELPISSAHFPTTDAIYQYIDRQNLEPIGFIIEDHQGHDPEDPHNPGTDHDYEGLPVFNLTMNQAESLVDGYAPAGSYAVEILYRF